jgi:hypothetical protein
MQDPVPQEAARLNPGLAFRESRALCRVKVAFGKGGWVWESGVE